MPPSRKAAACVRPPTLSCQGAHNRPEPTHKTAVNLADPPLGTPLAKVPAMTSSAASTLSAVTATVIVRVFAVHAAKSDALEAALGLLVKRAKRLGVAPLTWTWGPTTTKRVKIEGLGDPSDGGPVPTRLETRRELTLSGESPCLDGWQFRATLQHMDGANILRAVPVSDEAELLPAAYRTRGPMCDHCRTLRQRNDTYVLYHSVSGRWTQVGSSCLADFIGSDKAGILASVAELYGYACALAEEGEEEESSGAGGAGGRGTEGLLSYLVLAATAVRSWGWISATTAREHEGMTCTRDRIAAARSPICKPENRLPASIEADETRAAAALAWALELTDGEVERSDYLWNLRTIARAGIVEYRTNGIACSMIAAHDKAMARETERASRSAKRPSEWFGTVKQRAVYTLELKGVNTWEGTYGYTHMYRFVNSAGNVAIWKSSNLIQELEVGGVYTIKGTVKAHGEWKDIKQTQLTRCTVEGVIKAASMPGTEGAKEES